MDLYIPSTFGVDQRDDKLKVAAYGRLARAAAIFGVDRLVIYRDDDPKTDEARNAELLEKYLSYAETPPYLRKELIPRDPDLEYASIMPALQIVSHGYTDEFREAAVVETGEGRSVVEAGLDDRVELPEEVPEGTRLTLHMGEEPRIVDPANIDGFWTFTVENRREDLGDVVSESTVPVVGTSRHGDPLPAFADSRFVDMDIGLAFGSAWRGLPDLIDRGDCSSEDFAGMYDFVPGQETKTVRTEEAVEIVLGVVNGLRSL
ncbi:MAG: putative RNA uridine N3 methyltransferase [Candidatus Nanohaloarchaea archaeon]